MKILKNRLVFVIMSLVLFVTGIFSMGGIDTKKANALSSEYNGEPNTIYYFTDYYPTLTYNDLTSEFPNYNVVYDRQFIGESQFTNMVNNGYFSGFDYGTCVVIIDIKLFKPNPYVLYNLFSNLQQQQGCITAFVSAYAESAYNDISFLNHVNVFVRDEDFIGLRNFFAYAFEDLDSGNVMMDSTTYLIDGNLVNIYSFFDEDMDTLCAGSPFLRFFLEELIVWLEIDFYDTYEQIADELRSDFPEIKILVYDVNNDYFVDILTWNVYSYNAIRQQIREGDLDDAICAFGFWEFTDGFYEILYDIQYAEEYDIPIYVLATGPVSCGPNGLRVNMLSGAIYFDEAAYTLLDGLSECIE